MTTQTFASISRQFNAQADKIIAKLGAVYSDVSLVHGGMYGGILVMAPSEARANAVAADISAIDRSVGGAAVAQPATFQADEDAQTSWFALVDLDGVAS